MTPGPPAGTSGHWSLSGVLWDGIGVDWLFSMTSAVFQYIVALDQVLPYEPDIIQFSAFSVFHSTYSYDLVASPEPLFLILSSCLLSKYILILG